MRVSTQSIGMYTNLCVVISSSAYLDYLMFVKGQIFEVDFTYMLVKDMDVILEMIRKFLAFFRI